MSLLTTISTWPAQRWPWLLLGGSALALELVALYFQYGMGLEPCVMCVYQRAAVMGIAIAGFLGATAPTNLFIRVAAMTTWGVAAFWGLDIAYEHVQMQNPDNFLLAMSCDIYPNFPTWLAIHEWFPAVFEARGTCDSIDWMFLGLSMPAWMVVTFAVYSLTLALVLGLRLLTLRSI